MLTQVRETIFTHLLLIIHVILHARCGVWINCPDKITIHESCIVTGRHEIVDMHLQVEIAHYTRYCVIHIDE